MLEIQPLQKKIDEIEHLNGRLKKFYNTYENEDLLLLEAEKSKVDDIVKRLSIANETDFPVYFIDKRELIKDNRVDLINFKTLFGSTCYNLEDLGSRDKIDEVNFKMNNSEFRFRSHVFTTEEEIDKEDLQTLSQIIK